VGGTGFYVRALFEEYSGLKDAPDPATRERLGRRLRQDGLQPLVEELTQRSPELAQATDLQNPVRVRRALERLDDPRPPIQFSLPPFRRYKFVLDPPKEDLDRAIAIRAESMFALGWVSEVRSLLEKGVPRTAPAFRAIGYDYVIDLIEGRLGEDEAKARTIAATRQYAKRQRTWLRSEPNSITIAHPALDQICNAMQSG
jgi:tRNA dimethylallyltransferase